MEVEIHEVIAAIRAKRFDSLEIRRHFTDMIKERELAISEVRNVLQKCPIEGITHQGQNIYKVILSFKKDKDLNIVIGVSEKKDLRLISVFPSEIVRRIKHGKK